MNRINKNLFKTWKNIDRQYQQMIKNESCQGNTILFGANENYNRNINLLDNVLIEQNTDKLNYQEQNILNELIIHANNNKTIYITDNITPVLNKDKHIININHNNKINLFSNDFQENWNILQLFLDFENIKHYNHFEMASHYLYRALQLIQHNNNTNSFPISQTIKFFENEEFRNKQCELVLNDEKQEYKFLANYFNGTYSGKHIDIIGMVNELLKPIKENDIFNNIIDLNHETDSLFRKMTSSTKNIIHICIDQNDFTNEEYKSLYSALIYLIDIYYTRRFDKFNRYKSLLEHSIYKNLLHHSFNNRLGVITCSQKGFNFNNFNFKQNHYLSNPLYINNIIHTIDDEHIGDLCILKDGFPLNLISNDNYKTFNNKNITSNYMLSQRTHLHSSYYHHSYIDLK